MLALGQAAPSAWFPRAEPAEVAARREDLEMQQRW